MEKQVIHLGKKNEGLWNQQFNSNYIFEKMIKRLVQILYAKDIQEFLLFKYKDMEWRFTELIESYIYHDLSWFVWLIQDMQMKLFIEFDVKNYNI